jgi:signal peptidase II
MKSAIAIILAGIVSDFISKAWALDALTPHEPVQILPVLSLTLGFNPGVAFDLHWQGWHWPAFNVADILICAGVVLIAVASLFGAPSKTETRSV